MLDHHTDTVPGRDTPQPAAPLSVRNAARVMYTGAVAAVILIVVEFVTAGATKTALGRRYPRLSANELTTITHVTVISEALVALIAAVLFVWIARSCMDGKNWARITAAVLCALGILDAFPALTVPHLRADKSPADLILSFLVAGIGLVSICILSRPSSNAYFRQLRRHGEPVMNNKALGDPLAVMSCPERRKWRQAERRVVREHNARQLTTLRSLAATGGGLTGLIYPDSGSYATSAEFMIAGKRIRAGRVHRPTLSALTRALGSMPAVAPLTASRYGPYWVLTFELATAPLVVLVDKLSILPDRHGGPAPLTAPTAPADGRHRSTWLGPYLNQDEAVSVAVAGVSLDGLKGLEQLATTTCIPALAG